MDPGRRPLVALGIVERLVSPHLVAGRAADQPDPRIGVVVGHVPGHQRVRDVIQADPVLRVFAERLPRITDVVVRQRDLR